MSSFMRFSITIVQKKWSHILLQVTQFVFLLQFVSWFQNYWLGSTTKLVYVVLSVLFATELLLARLPWKIRIWVQMLGILLCHYLLFDFRFVVDGGLWPSIVHIVEQIGQQLHPYIWFSLAAWGVYLLASYLFRTRSGAFITMLATVVVFAIADSYTGIYLWQEVAVIVICGLLLMINRHFDEFRRKHPNTWRHIADYPWGIAFTATLLVGFVFLMSGIAPNVRPLIVDPYTAWNQLQGKRIDFSVKDDTLSAIASFQSNLWSTSGYSRNDSVLGGGFKYNYDPIIEVTSKVRTYWRGESKSVYTGSGWKSADITVFQEISAGDDIPQMEHAAAPSGTNEFSQNIRILDGEEPRVIFGAFPLSNLDSINGDEDSEQFLLWNAHDSELTAVPESGIIHQYQVTSLIPVYSYEQYLHAEIPTGEEWEEYLQLPDSVPERVYDLAREITANVDTPYEKAKAIELYLRQTYPYNAMPDDSKGVSKDFVDRFLFEVQEGYCDYFSTAMAVMMRTLDIPSRWVKGYTTGSMDDESAMLMEQYRRGGSEPADLEITYTVRNSDAHSWVEVYLDGIGWTSFEPTSSFSMPVVHAVNGETEVIIPDFATPGLIADSPDTEAEDVAKAGIMVAIAAVFALLVWLFRGKLRKIKLPGLRNLLTNFGLAAKPNRSNDQIIIDFNRMLHYFRKKGLQREEYQTVREAAHIWGVQKPAIREKLNLAIYCFEQAKYSSVTMTDADVDRFQAAIRYLKEEVS